MKWLLMLVFAFGAVGVGWSAAAEPGSVWTEEAAVAALRKGEVPPGVDARFVAAVRKIEELRGQLDFDSAGRLVGADLASDRISVTDSEVEHLRAFPNLKRLRVSGSALGRRGIEHISQLSGLTELALLNVPLDNEGLGLLASLGGLTSLSIHRTAVLNDAGLVHLRRFPQLVHLGLLEVGITDRGVAQIVGELPKLRLLDVRNCAQVTNSGIERLRGLAELRVLRLGGHQINDDTLAIVGRMPRLVGLTVQEAVITDAGLAHLRDLPLEELQLFRCYGISDEGLGHLAAFTKLRRLMLRDLAITGSGLVVLRHMPELSILRLSETGVDDSAVGHVMALPKLTRLELRQTRVTDAGMEAVGRLAALEYLDLSATQVGDAGIVRLGGLRKLRFLDLTQNAGVTDGAVPALARLTSLRDLNLQQTSLSDEGFRRLQDALPGCRIQR